MVISSDNILLSKLKVESEEYGGKQWYHSDINAKSRE